MSAGDLDTTAGTAEAHELGFEESSAQMPLVCHQRPSITDVGGISIALCAMPAAELLAARLALEGLLTLLPHGSLCVLGITTKGFRAREEVDLAVKAISALFTCVWIVCQVRILDVEVFNVDLSSFFQRSFLKCFINNS